MTKKIINAVLYMMTLIMALIYIAVLPIAMVILYPLSIVISLIMTHSIVDGIDLIKESLCVPVYMISGKMVADLLA